MRVGPAGLNDGDVLAPREREDVFGFCKMTSHVSDGRASLDRRPQGMSERLFWRIVAGTVNGTATGRGTMRSWMTR